MGVRDDISNVLGVQIQEGRWEAYISMLDREGKFTRRSMLAMVMVMCKAMEQQEKTNELLLGKIDQLEQASKETTIVNTPETISIPSAPKDMVYVIKEKDIHVSPKRSTSKKLSV